MQKNKLFTAILSVLIALGLWIFVVTVVSPESDTRITVPITYQGEEVLRERELMLMPGATQNVTIRIQGNRSDLNRLGPGNVTASVDLSAIQEADHYNLNIKVSVGDNTMTSGFVVQDKQPGTASVTIGSYRAKDVPVRLSYEGEMGEGLIFDLDDAVLSTNTVSISGPAEVVDAIEAAKITIDATGLTQSVDADFRPTLVDGNDQPVDAADVVANVAEIHVNMTVEHIKTVPLTVQLVYGGGVRAENVECTIDPSSITISGSEEALSRIDEVSLGSISMADVSGDTKQKLEIRLPETVTNRSAKTEATVSLKLKNLQTRRFYVTSFTPINVPAGYQATIVTSQLEVIVRGDSASVLALRADNLKVEVDCSSIGVGTVTIPATVSVTSGTDKVGIVGKYTVSVTLTKLPVEINGPEDGG